MLQFPYQNLLKSYEYNQTAFLCDLTKRIDAHEQLSRRSERTEHFHLPVADRTAGEAIRNILRNSINWQKESLDKEWEGAYGAGYPFIRAENGDREAKAIAEEISVTDSSKDGWYHIPDRMCAGKADREAKAIAEEISVTDSSKDGWYHIPDRMCAGKADRESIRMFEKECQQTGRRIPYAVGKQLEDIFINAKADHKQIWAHRTGLSIDGGDLASIANHGLAVPAQGHGLDELPELGYTATKFTMTTNGFIHLLYASALEEYKHMRGTVICLTDENPNISRGYLDPGQVVGYVARDEKGHVCKFLEPSEMAQCHNTKTILKDGIQVEVDRKSNVDLKEQDYFPCRIEGLGEVWLVNDSHDGNLKNCSIACENRIYGNLSLFALEKQLTISQMQTVQAEIRRFENTVKASAAYGPGHGKEQDLSWFDAEAARQACLSGHGKDQSVSLIDELNAMDLDTEGNKNPEFQRDAGDELDH